MRRSSRLRLVLAAPVAFLLAFAVALPPASFAQEDGPPDDAAGTEGSAIDDAEPAPPTAEEALAAAAAANAAAEADLKLAFQSLAERDWEACIAPFLAVAQRMEPHAVLGGLRDQCLYNVACAYARIGRPAEAVAAFARSIEHGLRAVVIPTADGRVEVARGLTLAHLLVDSDLDSLRDRDDFRAVLDPLLRGGEPVLETTPAVVAGERAPGLVVLLSEDRDVLAGGAPWRYALAQVPAIVCFVEGPVRPQPNAKRWMLSDGDDRFAAQRIEEALDLLRADPRVDPAHVIVTAASPLAAEAGLAVALARPHDVAGVVFGPFRYHAAWHADALAEVATSRAGLAPWSVTLVTPQGAVAEALRSTGATVEVLDVPDESASAEQSPKDAAGDEVGDVATGRGADTAGGSTSAGAAFPEAPAVLGSPAASGPPSNAELAAHVAALRRTVIAAAAAAVGR